MAQKAPLEAAAPTIAAASALAKKLNRPYLSDEWRPQLENLLGLAMRVERGALIVGDELTPIDSKVFRGPDDRLMKSLKITDSNTAVYSYTVDSTVEAKLAAALGAAGLKQEEMESVDVTTTLEAWLDKASDQFNVIAAEIRQWLDPGQAALWITGINVYRIQHVRYSLRTKKMDIGAGAVSVGGSIYNKASSKIVSTRLIPVGFVVTRADESATRTIRVSATRRPGIDALGALRIMAIAKSTRARRRR
ncbi:MAG: hypothetical protein U0704_04850 [Candidatus Eisenbacteria bacterium]